MSMPSQPAVSDRNLAAHQHDDDNARNSKRAQIREALMHRQTEGTMENGRDPITQEDCPQLMLRDGPVSGPAAHPLGCSLIVHVQGQQRSETQWRLAGAH